MESQISSRQLKRFVKHLCRVSNRYHEREKAKKSVELHLKKIKKSDEVNDNISSLNKKINILLEKQSKVAELGLKKNASKEIQRQINLLEEQLRLTQEERDNLLEENEELKKVLDGLATSSVDVDEEKSITEKKVEKVEKVVDKKYKQAQIEELRDKIKLLEQNYKEISKDKSISPNRLFKIEEKIREYKQKLRKFS
jgi:chromosome segregation ATPase